MKIIWEKELGLMNPPAHEVHSFQILLSSVLTDLGEKQHQLNLSRDISDITFLSDSLRLLHQRFLHR